MLQTLACTPVHLLCGFRCLYLRQLGWLLVQCSRAAPVSYTHLDVYKRQGQDCSRFPDGAGAVWLGFIPIGREAEHWARVTGTERANDEVVNLVAVLQYDELGVVVEADAQLLAGRTAVGEQTRSKPRIDPRPRDDFRTQGRRA